MVQHSTLTSSDLHFTKIRTGSGNPNTTQVTATYIGDVYADTATNIVYYRKTNAGSAGDWVAGNGITLAGTGSLTLTLTANTNVTLPTTGTLATLAGSESLTNKTISSSTLNIVDTDLTIKDDIDNTKILKFNAGGVATGTTRTLTAPNADTTIVGTDAAQTISNKTLNNTNEVDIQDTKLVLENLSDSTKKAKFDLSGNTTGTTRTYAVPDASTTLVGTATTQTLTNKTISGSSNTLTVLAGSQLTGQTPIANGGTGQATKAAAFDALAPATTKGDIIAFSTTNDRLGVGPDGQVLTADSTQTLGVKWGAVSVTLDSSTDDINLTLVTSVATNAMTIALKTKAGTDASVGDPIKVAFRNATNATGNYSVVTLSSALSTVISSGSTLGQSNATAEPIYVYLINNAGSIEIAYSTTLFDCTVRQSTTAEGGAGAADDRYTLYSTTARTNVAIRLVGKLVSSQTTAGTWATNASEVKILPISDTQANVVLGRIDGALPKNGYIGEYKEAIQSTPTNTAANNTWSDGASFVLTPGEWDLAGSADFSQNGATVTAVLLGISSTTGNSASGLTFGYNAFSAQGPTAVFDTPLWVPNYRVSVSTPTTYYLKVKANFSAGTPQVAFSLRARRVG